MTDGAPSFERFGEVADQYDPDAIEERVFEYWEAIDAYERTKEHRSGGETVFFVDGPPYTSGSAHMGTTWNKALKDVYIRHLRMSGYNVTDRPGFDMHGLPIETKVEEELGFENKKDIAEYGEDRFIEACKDFAEKNLDQLREDFESFGVWMDWENPYRTVDPSYMEAAWLGFARAHERGLVEQGQRSINQCPRCETAIANNEVEYHDVEKPSIYVRFPLADREGSLVIWTTTPWTIVANTFVAVDESLEYVAVDARGGDGETDRLYVAEECLEEVLSAGRYEEYEVVEHYSGAELVGWTYEHPLAEQVPDHAQGDGALQVYDADYVEADRTGLVHSAPGHGEEDFERGQELGLDIFCPVGSDGVYTEAAGAYAGEFVRDVNSDVIADLDAEEHLLASEDGHSVREGQCWRCDTDIVRIVTDQWFITITDVKDELLENIEDSEWYPAWARDNRFRDFVEDAPDWNVSRQRYWGIPIPIWTPAEDGESEGWSGTVEDAIVIGDREELAARVDQDIDPETVDLHKGTVDELTITADGTTYTRIEDVFDVWLDSSVATWGTLGYPESETAFEERWPADLIIEAHDQTRGWFWSQLGMGTAAMGEIPYRDVLMHGHALDEDGRKMSKSVGNVIQPEEAIEREGRDAMRLFLLSFTGQGEDMRFSWEEMANRARQLNILWNVFRFPLPYMRMDGFDPAERSIEDLESDLETVDRWILSRLQTVEATMADHLSVYEQDVALETLLEFVVEDLSRYYVQAVRDRVWEEDESASKAAVYATLYRVLRETVALLAPYAPFVTEAIYGHLTGEDDHPTVHMCDWPEPDAGWREEALETDIRILRAIEQAGGAARQQAGRSRRWPVPRVVVDAPAARIAEAVRNHADLLGDRLNARAVEVVEPDTEWDELTYAAEADMSELGPAVGEDAGAVMTALNEANVETWSTEALAETVAEKTGVEIAIDDSMVDPVRSVPAETTQESFEVAIGDDESVPGRVYVDTALSPELESEGYAREIIRRAQELRKELDLDVEADVRLELSVEDDRIEGLIDDRAELIDEEVRVAERGPVEAGPRTTDTIEGIEVTIAIAPLASASA